jgi:predicted dehydrogenase
MLLDRGGLDAVVLATPHPSHAVAAVAAARAGLHVLVEKPMALTPDECSEMIHAADEAGVILSVVSQRRWYPAVRRVRVAIEDGRIGEPGLATVEVLGWRGADYFAMDAWRGTLAGEGGGVLINQAVHQLDLVSWFLGPVAEVDGWTANLNHPAIDVEDTAVAIVRFASGALASVVASNSQRPGLHGRVHVHGRNGASVGVETDSGSPFVAGLSPPTIARNDLWTVPGEDDALERWAAEDRDALTGVDIASHFHELQLRDVVEAIRTGRRPAVDGADGRTTVALVSAIYDAARTGRRVTKSLPEDR